MAQTNRNIALDISRAICAIWIIALWHYRDFIDNETFNDLVLNKLHGEYITAGVLSCFMFLSGFFLKKYRFCSYNDIINFAKKRFWRFYLLLVIAASLMLLPKMQLMKFFTLLTGTSVFLQDQPSTLWFFGDLMFFYALTPFVLWKSNCQYAPIFKATLSYILICVLYMVFDFNVRVIMYMPLYFLGLFFKDEYITFFRKLKVVVLSFIAIIGCYYIPMDIYPLYQVSVTSVILCLGYLIEKYTSFTSIMMSKIAYASMCAYLFHKFIMSTYYYKVGPINGITSIFFIFILFIGAYLFQLLYDKILIKLKL